MSEPNQPQSSAPTHLRPVTIEIPATWTPEQALAVYEILYELREKIWALYDFRLQDLLKEQQGYTTIGNQDILPSDRPF